MFIPTTPKDREEMLKAIGAASIKDLLKQVPANFCTAFDLPGTSRRAADGQAHEDLAAANTPVLSFLGRRYERTSPRR